MRVQLEKDGATILLNGEPLARGGEAVIWAVPEHPALLAKVYHQPTPEQADKLAAMLANPPDDPTAKQGHTSIAWPIQRLLGEDRRCVGFVMPRVDKTRTLFEVYNPKSRLQTWPLFHYGYLLRTARNLAIAVRALHARGYVLGDLNESNVLVNVQTLVTVVDTDSFQVRAGERVFRCAVGKPEYSAPEIQGADFQRIDRTPQQDDFALAVLIFQLLMQGTHPFAGRFTGEGEPETVARRIAAGNWSYARKQTGPYEPNPTAPPFSVVPPRVRELMRQCFEDGHDQPSLRPDAAAWQKALAEADAALTKCVANGQHRFPKGLNACPWCELARKQRRDPFPAKGKAPSGAEKSGSHQPAPTAVSAVRTRPAAPLADALPLPDAIPVAQPQQRKPTAAPSSFLSTPWPWVIGAAALLLFVGVTVGGAIMVWRASRPAPVVFVDSAATSDSGKPRMAVPAPRPQERPPAPGDRAGAPAGPGDPAGAGGAEPGAPPGPGRRRQAGRPRCRPGRRAGARRRPADGARGAATG